MKWEQVIVNLAPKDFLTAIEGKEVVLTGINLSAWGLDSTNPEL
jgi:hypothetical protein